MEEFDEEICVKIHHENRRKIFSGRGSQPPKYFQENTERESSKREKRERT